MRARHPTSNPGGEGFMDGFSSWLLGLGLDGEVEGFIDGISRWLLRLGVGVVAWLENGNGLC